MSDERKEEEQQESSFVVKDRRRFTPEGEERDEAEAPDPPPPADELAADVPAADEPAAAEPAPGEQATAPGGELPEMDFGTFVLSLARSAILHMEGQELPDGSRRKDVEMARQTIDILAMLQDKTKGNLTEEEAKLMEQVLYELRMVFLQAMG